MMTKQVFLRPFDIMADPMSHHFCIYHLWTVALDHTGFDGSGFIKGRAIIDLTPHIYVWAGDFLM